MSQRSFAAFICTFLLFATAARAQEPAFTFFLAYEGNTPIVEPPLTEYRLDVHASLERHGLALTEEGVNGWSISVSLSGCELLAATVDGTVAASDDAVPPGLLTDGFELTELVDPDLVPGAETDPQGAGAVSAVVLGFVEMSVLPIGGAPDHRVLTLALGATTPLTEETCVSCELAFVDGLQGSGQPVVNRVAWGTTSRRPGTLAIGIDVCASGVPPPDADGDGVPDKTDNCRLQLNPGQEDGDSDGVGDLCDNCPRTGIREQENSDGDGIGDLCDSCPAVSNPIQTDSDGDGVGYVCDNCPQTANPAQVDGDEDGVGDACEPAPRFRRGDVNGSREVDISDGVSIVEYLFLGTAAPVCLDAADSNDDGSVDLSDTAYVLNWLFQGGASPTAPGPVDCGSDSTVDSLTECAYPQGSC